MHEEPGASKQFSGFDVFAAMMPSIACVDSRLRKPDEDVASQAMDGKPPISRLEMEAQL